MNFAYKCLDALIFSYTYFISEFKLNFRIFFKF